MALKIIDFVTMKRGQIERDPLGEGEANARRAIDAFIKGRGSDKFRDYMVQFVETDEAGNPTELRGTAQLARLMAVDEPIPGVEMNRKRAYLLANAICGGGSPDNGGRFDFTVDTIDTGLP